MIGYADPVAKDVPTLQTAVQALHDIVVRDGKAQAPNRLAELAEAVIFGLAARGLPGARAEVIIPAGGRDKAWDVGWEWRGKFRLVLSLKSILRNIPGTVPNRIDDAMGETASIQLYSPEVVTGYVMLFSKAEDTHSKKHGMLWSEYLTSKLEALSGRRAPYWSPGTFEAYTVALVDMKKPSVVSGAQEFERALDRLVDEVHVRNPGIKEDLG